MLKVTTSLSSLVVPRSSFLFPYLRFSSTYYEVKNRCDIRLWTRQVRLSLSTYTGSLFSASWHYSLDKELNKTRSMLLDKRNDVD